MSRALRRSARGFTLTELMIVVSMVGVLAALAVAGYRKYIEGAKISEPIAVMQSIRSAEEDFQNKTMAYLNVSQTGYYPRAANDSKKAAWNNPSHGDYGRWQTLGVTVSGAVRFGYKVNSGGAGQAVAVPIDYKPAPNLGTPTKPWYVVQASGDPNENGAPTVLLATSFSSEVIYNEDQLAPVKTRFAAVPFLSREGQQTPSEAPRWPHPRRQQPWPSSPVVSRHPPAKEHTLMRNFKRIKARGFTLVELMIVVAIIGVLAALAIYGVRRYLASAKSAEARNTIGAINRGAVTAYERETTASQLVNEGDTSAASNHSLCLSAAPVPVTVPPGKKYQPNTANNTDFNAGTASSGWKCLRFSMNEPHYYQYHYYQGAGYIGPAKGAPDPTATGWESAAVGDLDGDNVVSLYSTGGTVNPTTKEAKTFTQVFEVDGDELDSPRPSAVSPGPGAASSAAGASC